MKPKSIYALIGATMKYGDKWAKKHGVSRRDVININGNRKWEFDNLKGIHGVSITLVGIGKWWLYTVVAHEMIDYMNLMRGTVEQVRFVSDSPNALFAERVMSGEELRNHCARSCGELSCVDVNILEKHAKQFGDNPLEWPVGVAMQEQLIREMKRLTRELQNLNVPQI